MTTLPAWMGPQTAADGPGTLPLPRASRRHRVRATLGALARALAQLLTDDAVAQRDGLLQRMHPQAKVLGLLGLLVVTTMLHALPPLLGAYALCVFLALLSRVPAARLLGIWVAVPLFSAALMLPALLNVVTPGAPLLTLWHAPPMPQLGPWPMPRTLAITDAGVMLATRFVLRVAVCVTLAMLLAITTRPDRLFRGLRAFGVPVIFVMLLSMMQRYLATLLKAAEELHLARLSRTIAVTPAREERDWVAGSIGALFRRSQALADQVHLAMRARGYTGEVHLLREPRWRATDLLALLACAALAVGLLIWR